jgi:hypothetical protein
MGSAEFADAQRRLMELGPDGFLEEISAKSHADIDEWQTQMQLKPMRVGTLHLFTEGLSPAERALTGVEIVDSLAGAVRACVARSGDRRVAVVPEGPYVVPRYEPAP